MRKILLVAVLLVSGQVFAAQATKTQVKMNAADVAVPVVPDTTSVTNQQVGQIIYDASTDQFKGLNTSGNWDAMSSPNNNPVISSGSSERIERAMITNTAGSPIVSSESGDWIQNISFHNTGDMTLNFVTGAFSAAPSCTCMAYENVTAPFILCMAKTVSASGIRIFTVGNSSTPYNRNFDIVCMGPR